MFNDLCDVDFTARGNDDNPVILTVFNASLSHSHQRAKFHGFNCTVAQCVLVMREV